MRAAHVIQKALCTWNAGTPGFFFGANGDAYRKRSMDIKPYLTLFQLSHPDGFIRKTYLSFRVWSGSCSTGPATSLAFVWNLGVLAIVRSDGKIFSKRNLNKQQMKGKHRLHEHNTLTVLYEK